jgi:transcriptional regulator of heat shock response
VCQNDDINKGMSMQLTRRQKEILYAIVTEFIETAQPVGSGLISEKYEIDASPATIRYEMVRLSDEGFISKFHSSSGRIPTVMGYRYYLSDLMDEEDINYLTEIKLNRELSNIRFQRDKLIRGINTLLADLTTYASLIVTNDGVYYSGLYNLLEYPEFQDKETFRNILLAFDDLGTLMRIFTSGRYTNKVRAIIGEEFEEPVLKDCSVVFTNITLYNGENAILAIVGPRRMHFAKVIPLIKLTSDIISKLLLGWEK